MDDEGAEQDDEEDDGLGDKDPEKEEPVDGGKVELAQREEDEGGKGEAADKLAQAPGLCLRNEG